MTAQETQKNDLIAQAYERYKLERAQRQAEEKAAADERAKTQATWEEMKKPKTVVTRKVHVCAECGASIPAGSKVTVRSELTNISNRGYTMAFLTKHYCGKCRPVEKSPEETSVFDAECARLRAELKGFMQEA